MSKFLENHGMLVAAGAVAVFLMAASIFGTTDEGAAGQPPAEQLQAAQVDGEQSREAQKAEDAQEEQQKAGFSENVTSVNSPNAGGGQA